MSYLTKEELQTHLINIDYNKWVDTEYASAINKQRKNCLNLTASEVASVSVMFDRDFRNGTDPKEYQTNLDLNKFMIRVVSNLNLISGDASWLKMWNDPQEAENVLEIIFSPKEYNLEGLPSVADNITSLTAIPLTTRLNWFDMSVATSGLNLIHDTVRARYWRGSETHPLLAAIELFKVISKFNCVKDTFIHLPNENHLSLIDQLKYELIDLTDPDDMVFFESLRYMMRDILLTSNFIDFKKYGINVNRTSIDGVYTYSFQLGECILDDWQLVNVKFNIEIWIDKETNIPLCKINHLVFPLPTYWTLRHFES